MVTLRVVGLPRQDAMATRLDAVLEHVELSPPLANWPALPFTPEDPLIVAKQNPSDPVA